MLTEKITSWMVEHWLSSSFDAIQICSLRCLKMLYDPSILKIVTRNSHDEQRQTSIDKLVIIFLNMVVYVMVYQANNLCLNGIQSTDLTFNKQTVMGVTLCRSYFSKLSDRIIFS